MEKGVSKEDWRILIYDCYSTHPIVSDFACVLPTNKWRNNNLTTVKYESERVRQAKLLLWHICQSLTIPKLLVKMPYTKFRDIRALLMKKTSIGKGLVKVEHNQEELKLSDVECKAIYKIRAMLAKYAYPCEKLTKIFTVNVKDGYNDEIKSLNKLTHDMSDEAKARYRKKVDAKKKKEAMCHAFSDPIAKFFMTIILCVWWVIKVIWNTIVFILWKNIMCRVGRVLRWIGKNLWIFIVYMWHVLKDRKQGVCPYMPFTDPDDEDKPEEQAESKSE